MKKLAYLAMFFAVPLFAGTNIEDNSVVSNMNCNNIEEKTVVVFSSGEKTTYEVTKEKVVNGVKVTFVVGVDINNSISSIAVKGNVPEETISNIQDKVTGGCFTKCTRAHGCSDKPTGWGVALCAAECALDCL